MFNKKYICLVALCVCLLPVWALAAPATPPTLNVPALRDMINMNKGKVILLNFFATWCPPCREEIPSLVALVQQYPADKFVIIGISVDQDIKLVQPFVDKMGINYSVFMAAEDIPALYGVRTIPHNVVYDSKGTLAANAPGYASEADLKEFIDTLLEQKNK
ncbi:MAG: TlpA disulfide reductase family protein [Desulfovibrionaceae bacterium]